MTTTTMTEQHLALSLKAVSHVIHRMQADPRLAYLIGPGSETYDLLTAAAAAPAGFDEDWYREHLSGQLKFQPVSAIGAADVVIDKAVLARIAAYDSPDYSWHDRDGLNNLVNHFVGRGLDVAEAERDTRTKELFR